MATLRSSLTRLFLLLALIGTLLLAWSLVDLWQTITERHESRQRSQIATLANATRAVMANQEVLLELLGRELLFHGEFEAGANGDVRLLDDLLDLNPLVAVYVLTDPAGDVLVINSGFEGVPLPNLARLSSTMESFEGALASDRMIVGRPLYVEVLERWVIPLAKAIRRTDGEIAGVLTAGMYLDGANPFFSPETYLGPRNTLQIVRGTDLYPLHWASRLDQPAGYFRNAIPREYYDHAVASAEARSGQDIEFIKASRRPHSYRVVNALGPHLGMTVYDPTYDFWVLSQTHLDQLRLEFLRAGSVYVVVFVLLLVMILVALVSISRGERKRQAELIHKADHDGLTGLPNRRRMVQDFRKMQHAYPDGLAVLFIDMDNFKSFNDGFGHMLGDRLLQLLGQRLADFIDENECIARVGGDEFVLLSPETNAETLLKRANDLIATLTQPSQLDGVLCELGCSIGIARTGDAGESLDEVLRAADVAMYAAKTRRNTARLYEPSMGRQYLENIAIEQRLQVGIQQRSIRMEYQPQFDAERRLIGIEALARWNDAELGEIEPEQFIAIAEASGLIDRMGDYILDRSLGEIDRLSDQTDAPLRLSINISVRQFMGPDFTERLLRRIRDLSSNSVRLVIEITESLFMEDLETITTHLEKLRLAEIQVALDDFGTGYSSLGLLRQLPIDELKIDRGFITDLATDEYARKLVQSIIGIGKTHGVRVVAEGVENEEEFELLKAYGCDAFQGYLFARPLALADLAAFLADLQPSPDSIDSRGDSV
jgi:diguanylate cyclase (GGDEF)-like protein